VVIPVRAWRPEERREGGRGERGRVQPAFIGAVDARVHEAEVAELLHVEEHDARADFRGVPPFILDQVRMIRDRDGNVGSPAGELIPEERRVSQEEGIRVDVDGLFRRCLGAAHV